MSNTCAEYRKECEKKITISCDSPFYPDKIILLRRRFNEGSRTGVCRTKAAGFRPITIHQDGSISVTLTARTISPTVIHKMMMDRTYEVLTYDIFGTEVGRYPEYNEYI